MKNYEDIKAYHEGTITVAPAIGIGELDDHIRFKRNFSVIGGIGNVGKTTAWMYILFLWSYFHPDKLKFLMFLNENDDNEMAMQMIEWYNGKDITAQSREDIESALKWVNEHFYFLPNDYKSTVDQLLLKFWHIKNGIEGELLFDFDGVFIDPYNSLPVYDYKDHYKNASKFRECVNRFGAKMMVSMHANTEAQRKRDAETGLVKCPHIVDLEMGSMWFNRSDDSVTIHRHIQDAELKFTTEMHVQKIKHKRSGGDPTNSDEPIKMVWIHNRAGRYSFDNSKDPVPVPDGLTNSSIDFKMKPDDDFDDSPTDLFSGGS